MAETHIQDKKQGVVEEANCDPESGLNSSDAVETSVEHKESWKTREQQVLPNNNLPLVCGALGLAVFLAALDQTIVATSLPTIVAQLGGGKNYSWVGSSYLLASAAFNPVIGKLTDLIGRKHVFFPAIFVFLVGSALCGAAQNMIWLIVARAIQGIGGGAIVSMTQIIMSDIVPLHERGKWGAFIGSTWGIASILGPLVGGILTDHASWRWCFWINLPTGGIAVLALFFQLHLNPHQGKTFREHVAMFDFMGLFLLVTGIVCLLLGFNESEISWSSPITIALLAVGSVMLIVAGIHECSTKRSPLIPPRLFKTRTTTFILLISLLHVFAFFLGAFYLPLYFQVLGASATKAGLQMLPYSLGSSMTAALGGIMMSIFKGYKFAVACLGYGLMTMLDERSSLTVKVLYPLIAGLGIGGLFQTTIVAMQAAMPQKDTATAVASFALIRIIGSTMGVSIGQTIFTSELRRRISGIPGLDAIDTSSGGLVDNVRNLKNIQPDSLRQELFQAYTKSISILWVVGTPVIGVAFILGLLLKTYSLERNYIHATKDSKKEDDKLLNGIPIIPDSSDLEKNLPTSVSRQETRVERT